MYISRLNSQFFVQMRIPLDHFSSVPVFALSPQSPTSPEPETSPSLASAIRDKMSSLTPDLSMFYSTSSAGSAPSSPVSKRKMASVTSRPASAGPGAMMTSLPVVTSAQMSRYVRMMIVTDVRTIAITTDEDFTRDPSV